MIQFVSRLPRLRNDAANPIFNHLSVFVFVLVTSSLFSTAIFSAEQAGKDFPLLQVGLGARPVGMGGAYTAAANDSNAVFWNPAGTLLARHFEFATMQTHLASDLNVYYVSTVIQQRATENATPDSAIGFYWVNAGLAGIPLVTGNESTVTVNTDVKPYDFSQYSTNAVAASFAWWAAPNVAAGVAVAGIYQELSKVSQGRAGAITVTPGVLWLLDYRWALGATIHDVLNYQKWATGRTEYVIPEIRVGVSGLPKDWWLVSGEIRQKLNSRYAMTFHIGSELNAWEIVRLRAGYDDDHFTAGCGLIVSHVAVNYAFSANAPQALGDTHRISLEIGL